ncbi:TAXI family TRAP transporter solute-binding subunit [Nocardia flavorosea]|uniref:TAXI family TRAP transporter solute-binding subunit n=1 Tax=Nocardia flavorosea TaxID=53429 RepID=UPI003CC7EFFB
MNLAAASTRSRSVRITTVATAGSVTNLQMLELGTIDAALVLGDAAVALGTRGSAIGRLYETYIHLAGRRDSRFRHIGDLRGARADLGIAGSGGALTADRLFRTAGLTVRDRYHHDPPQALRSHPRAAFGNSRRGCLRRRRADPGHRGFGTRSATGPR